MYFLEKTRGLAVLGQAIIRAKDAQPGERDEYKDLKDLARRDNIWSIVVSLTLAEIIKQALKNGDNFRTIDVYHDPKSLTVMIQRRLKEAINDRMLSWCNKFIKKNKLNFGKKVSIRRLQPVAKATRGKSPDKFQRGVWIADQLSRDSRLFCKANQVTRVKSADFSEDVKAVLSDFIT